MKTNSIKPSLVTSIMISAPLAWAGPALSTSCPVAAQIITPSGAGSYYLSKDCHTVYILPPAKGFAKVVGTAAIKNLEDCDEIDSYQEALSKVDDQINQVLGNPQGKDSELQVLFKKRQEVQSAFGNGQIAKEEALDVNLIFDLNISQSVQRYQDWNPNLHLNFVPIAAKNLQVNWNGSNPTPADLPAAISNYISADSHGQIGTGSFNALTRLPLATMCSLADPFTGQLPTKLNYSQMAGTLAASVSYDYEIQATYTYAATFELAELASQIKSVSSSGGFFSTSTMSELLTNKDSSSWFKLNVTCDDSRVCEQVALDKALQIKTDLMKQVLDQIALLQGGSFQAGGAGEPGKDGAAVAADGLRKCPYVYCQVGAVVLDVANSTFGGTNKTDSFIASHHGWQSQNISESIPVAFKGNIGFTGN